MGLYLTTPSPSVIKEKMRRRTETLLSVSGFDPSGGAGALLDVRVFNRLGFHGAAVLTALTVQDTRGVDAVAEVPAWLVGKQFKALKRDLRIAGVKVGMLGSARGVEIMKEILEQTADVPRVVDPVFRSSSGLWLTKKRALSAFLDAVKGRATLITPNLSEAELMTGSRPRTVDGMTRAARRIQELTGLPCLVKGGHLKGLPVDVLFDGRRVYRFGHRRIGRDVHGSGCFLSSAILAHLAGGAALEEACRSAVRMTVAALAASTVVGRGRAVFSDPTSRREGRR